MQIAACTYKADDFSNIMETLANFYLMLKSLFWLSTLMRKMVARPKIYNFFM